MQKDKIVSFIVPAYNSEAYLQKCLASFCHEKILCSIEVLIINDGSTDRTAEIGEKYEKKYPGIFRLIYKENGGHGSAINVGSEKAQGKYIKVVDADDWVVTESLPEYIEALSNAAADVIVSPFYTVDMKTGLREASAINPALYNIPSTLESFLRVWDEIKNGFTFHGITYRTDFYRRYKHKLLEKIFYEDHEYSTIPCCFAEELLPLGIFLYVYQVGNVNQSISTHNQLRRVSHLKIVIDEMIRYSLNHKKVLSPAGWNFFLTKLEIVVLGYYRVVCLTEPVKSRGRQRARALCKKIRLELPSLHKKTRLRYYLFMLMNYLHISPETFSIFLQSGLYKNLKKLLKRKILHRDQRGNVWKAQK